MTLTHSIDAVDAIEIAEALQWLHDWFASDPGLGASLHRFSHGLITMADLRADLDRFAVALIGGQP